MKRALSKIDKWIINSPVVAKLTPEQEEEMTTRIANTINKIGIEAPALLLFEAISPVSLFASNLILLPLAPFLELFGVHGYRYVSLFEKTDNLKKLLDKIEKGTKK